MRVFQKPYIFLELSLYLSLQAFDSYNNDKTKYTQDTS